MSFDCDVIVAGGGPAGSAAAAWLARSGHRVILFERDLCPRFHIGESLLASVNDVLGAIGADDLVRQAGFPKKWGATFMTGDGRVERYADFASAPDVREQHHVLDAAFCALVTVFAGYWRPSLATRIWVALFFQLARFQRWVRFSQRLVASRPDVHESTTAAR